MQEESNGAAKTNAFDVLLGKRKIAATKVTKKGDALEQTDSTRSGSTKKIQSNASNNANRSYQVDPLASKKPREAAIESYQFLPRTASRTVLQEQLDERDEKYVQYRMREEDPNHDQSQDVWFCPGSLMYRQASNEKAAIQCYGVTDEGKSTCVVIHNFDPYMYVAIPPNWIEMYQNDHKSLNALCVRWFNHMRNFSKNFVEHHEDGKKFQKFSTPDGHVILPLEPSELHNVVQMGMKDVKGCRIDFKEDPQGKQVYTPVMRLRVSTPRFIPTLKRMFFYPAGIDGHACGLCNRTDNSQLLTSPFADGRPLSDEDAYHLLTFVNDDTGEVDTKLADWHRNKLKKTKWHDVCRHSHYCLSRFHGTCLRTWFTACTLRGDNPYADDQKHMFRCPSCVSYVQTVQQTVFTPRVNRFTSAKEQLHKRRSNPKHGWTLDETNDPVALLGEIENQEWQNEAEDVFFYSVDQQNENANDGEDDPVETRDKDDFRVEREFPGWLDAFILDEYNRSSGLRVLPLPRGTEAESWCTYARAEKTQTLPPNCIVSVYEANVDFVVRYYIDNDMSPSQWHIVPAGSYAVVPFSDPKRVSTCALELHCNAGATKRLMGVYPEDAPKNPLDDTDIWKKARDLNVQPLPPWVALIFDKEMNHPPFIFPHPRTDEIIQAQFMVRNMRTNQRKIVLFSKGSLAYDPPPDEEYNLTTNVYSFDTEEELIEEICRFVRVVQPDVFVHFNGNSFDIPFLYSRARHLGLTCARNFGSKCKEADIFYSNGAVRGRAITKVTVPGVINIDELLYAQENIKLKHYGLGSLSWKFLKQTKADIDHNVVHVLQQTPEGRAQLAEYAVMDILLTDRLLDAMRILESMRNFSVVMHTSIQNLQQNGSQYRTMCLFRHYYHHNHKGAFDDRCTGTIIPTNRSMEVDECIRLSKKKKEEAAYEGAIVIKPKVGATRNVVITLDFASMYPSEWTENNYGPSSCVYPELAEFFGIVIGQHAKRRPDFVFSDDVDGTPYHKSRKEELDNLLNPAFISNRIQRDGLSRISLMLKARRKYFKNCMEALENKLNLVKQLGLSECQDGMPIRVAKALYEYYDRCQLAVKIAMNTIYGWTGLSVTKGQLAMREVAESITKSAQRSVMTAKIAVEHEVTKANGFAVDAEIIYGDTDSIMIEFHGPPEVAQNVSYGQAIGVYLAKTVVKEALNAEVIEIEFEKIYKPRVQPVPKLYMANKILPSSKRSADIKGMRSQRADSSVMQCKCIDAMIRYFVDEYNPKKIVKEIAKVFADVRARRVPIQHMASSGSSSRDIWDDSTPPSKAMMASRREFFRSGRQVQIGERVTFVLVEVPTKLGKNKMSKKKGALHAEEKKSNKLEQASTAEHAELLEYAENAGLLYHMDHAIEDLINCCMSTMRLIWADFKGIEPDDAESYLRRKWTNQPEFLALTHLQVSDETKNAIEGLQTVVRCANCKVALEVKDANAKENAQSGTNCDNRNVAHSSVCDFKESRIRMKHNQQVQTRVRGIGLREHLMHNMMSHQDVLVSERYQTPQTRLRGGDLHSALLNLASKRIGTQVQDEVLQPSTVELCQVCKADPGDFLRRQDKTLQYELNELTQAWNTCRSCPGARMRGNSTVINCTSFECDAHGRRIDSDKDAMMAWRNVSASKRGRYIRAHDEALDSDVEAMEVC